MSVNARDSGGVWGERAARFTAQSVIVSACECDLSPSSVPFEVLAGPVRWEQSPCCSAHLFESVPSDGARKCLTRKVVIIFVIIVLSIVSVIVVVVVVVIIVILMVNIITQDGQSRTRNLDRV